MALSGHRTPEAARLYLKRTEMQRAIGARRRRAFEEMEERSADESQNRFPCRRVRLRGLALVGAGFELAAPCPQKCGMLSKIT